MTNWIFLAIALFSSVAFATTTHVVPLGKETWGEFIESHEVVIALCTLWEITFFLKFYSNSELMFCPSLRRSLTPEFPALHCEDLKLTIFLNPH